MSHCGFRDAAPAGLQYVVVDMTGLALRSADAAGLAGGAHINAGPNGQRRHCIS